jgi:hypothetical protein
VAPLSCANQNITTHHNNAPTTECLHLFGKVFADKRWQSCAAVVGGLHRSLLVVPAPTVFGDADGEIAAAEAAAAADPEQRMELLRLLHVSLAAAVRVC